MAIKDEFERSKFILDNDLLANATQDYGYLAAAEAAGKQEIIDQASIGIGGSEVKGISASQTKEAMDAAYKTGDRILALDFSWTEDGEIIAMKNRATFSSLLENPIRALTREAFLGAKLKSDLTPLDLKRTLDWLSRHKDSLIIAFSDQRSIEFSKYLYDNYKEALHRFVIVVDTFEKYHRLAYLEVDKIVLDADALKNSPDEIEQFIEENPVYMVVTSNERMSEEKKNNIAKLTNLYIRNGDQLIRFVPN
jgi:hypothetical protein